MNELLKDAWDPRPKCWNRPPIDGGRVRVYFDADGKKREIILSNSWFVDRCTQHDGRGIGPDGESYAMANRFNCEGCRWLPSEVIK